jgi:DNA-binding LacI/PurR family transcriptional regulator
VATVSRYLNQNAVVSEETAQRVQGAMRELNYVPQLAARSLATHRFLTIGLLLTEINSDFFAPLLKGIESVAREEGYGLLIATNDPMTSTGLPPIGPHNTDGLLVFLDSLEERILRDYSAQGFPMVLVQQVSPSGLDIPSVAIENKTALERVVDHVVEAHGRRNIAFLRGPQGNADSEWREAGYRAGLRKHGIPVDESTIAYGDYDRHIAYHSVKQLVGSRPDIDAIFTGDDEAAIGALRALRDLGRRVPEDVAVVGFDDQSLAPYLAPPLTTVHAPTEEVGTAAARQLFQLIKTGKAEPFVFLPTELIVRRSCGCAYEA